MSKQSPQTEIFLEEGFDPGQAYNITAELAVLKKFIRDLYETIEVAPYVAPNLLDTLLNCAMEKGDSKEKAAAKQAIASISKRERDQEVLRLLDKLMQTFFKGTKGAGDQLISRQNSLTQTQIKRFMVMLLGVLDRHITDPRTLEQIKRDIWAIKQSGVESLEGGVTSE